LLIRSDRRLDTTNRSVTSGPNGFAASPCDQWLLRRGGPNLLIIGCDAHVAEILAHVRPALERPRTFTGAAPLVLPPQRTGTVIIRGIDDLDRRAQTDVFEWLDTAPDVRTIATSPTALWPLVQRGLFLADLYYRVNMVTLTVTSNDAVERHGGGDR
jgi:hypothetical protein